jgi:hypothetical protein
LITVRKLSFCGLTAVLYCIAIAAQTNHLPLLLIEDAGFVPSGWMGDAEKDAGVIKVNESSAKRPGSPLPHSEQWIYRPKTGAIGWAGVAWQFPEKNWGDQPGKDFSKRGFSKVSFWARGVPDRSGILPKLLSCSRSGPRTLGQTAPHSSLTILPMTSGQARLDHHE